MIYSLCTPWMKKNDALYIHYSFVYFIFSVSGWHQGFPQQNMYNFNILTRQPLPTSSPKKI